MAAAGRRWQRCSSCGCRLMSASGQRPCCRSHGRGHHLPGRSTSIRALWRTAWLHESACWAVAVERWARRGATRRRERLFRPFCPLLDPPSRVVGHTPDKIHNVSPKHTALAPCDGGARRQHLVGPSRRSHGDRKRCPPPQKHHQLRTCAHPLLLRDEPQT